MQGVNRAVSNLDIPSNAIRFFSEQWGIKALHPPQFEAMDAVLSGRNTLLAIPTASGKSLVAYIAIVKKLLEQDPGGKAVYIVPLKALASEKYEELSELADAVGLTVGLGIGDSGQEAKRIKESDILVCTSEKLDSIMRNSPEAMANLSIVVADEFHLMNDGHRGPTLEINLSRLRYIRPNAQIIALSATVGNCEELAEWLNADLIKSDWRPVGLEYSTLHDSHLEPRLLQSSHMSSDSSSLNPPREVKGIKSMPTWGVVSDSIDQKGQVLIFVSTRRSAVSEARKLAERVEKRLAKEDPDRLVKLKELASKLDGRSQTSMGEALSKAISGGVAFHHAGLSHAQRKEVEAAFKSGLLVALTATPTLAAGVNLPARRVLVRDIKRFEDGMSRLITVMEIRQMLGRAGRPKYDDFGEAWVLCKGVDGWEEADKVSERYFFGQVEDVTSKLASEPAMRVHLLSAIATGGFRIRHEIGKFFASTFLGHTSNSDTLEATVDTILSWLVDERFIRRVGINPDHADKLANAEPEADWQDDVPLWASIAQNTGGVSITNRRIETSRSTPRRETSHSKPSLGFSTANSLRPSQSSWDDFGQESGAMEYEATQMGEKVCQLYLDPLSASIIRSGLRRGVRRLVRRDAPVSTFGLLHLACSTPDFTMLFAKHKEMEYNSDLRLKTSLVSEQLLVDSPYEERELGLVKSAWLIEEWIEESSLREIEKTLDVTPGDLHSRVDLMGWLMAASQVILRCDDVFSEEHMSEIATLLEELDLATKRVRNGCKEDLLELVSVRNIGRQRGRELAKAGIRNPRDLLDLSKKKREEISSWRGWGPILLDKIVKEVERLVLREQKAQPKPRSDDVPLEGERF